MASFSPYLDFLDSLADKPGVLPSWAVDRQRRARRTRAKILDQARTLLDTMDLADIPVQALARGAGISIGAFYARFPSKDAVLQLLGMALFHEIERAFSWALGPELGDAPSVDQLVSAYVTTRVHHTRRNRRLILALRQGGRNPSMPDAVQEVDARVHAVFLERAAAAGVATDEARAQARFALFVVDAAVSEGVLTRSLEWHGLPEDDGSLVHRLTRLATVALAG